MPRSLARREDVLKVVEEVIGSELLVLVARQPCLQHRLQSLLSNASVVALPPLHAATPEHHLARARRLHPRHSSFTRKVEQLALHHSAQARTPPRSPGQSTQAPVVDYVEKLHQHPTFLAS